MSPASKTAAPAALPGQPAPHDLLVNVPRLISAYYSGRPDPRWPRSAWPSAPGPPRLVLRQRLQRMARARDQPGDLRLPAPEGHRRPAVPRHRHPCTVDAGLQQRGRGAGGQRRRADALAGRRIHAHARRLARDPGLQPRPQQRAGRRHRDHALAQPARERRLQIQPAQRRPRRHRHHLGGRGRGQRLSRQRPAGREAPAAGAGAPGLDHAPARLPEHLCGGPGAGARHGRHPRRADRAGRRSAGRRGRALLARDRRALQARA